MEVALVHPQIPPNTGNVARLCAAVGAPLHLIEPLGFQITDRQLKRAGLDYWKWVDLHRHGNLEEFLQNRTAKRLCFFSKMAPRSYLEADFHLQDCLVFGSETEGLPAFLKEKFPTRFFRIPILQPGVRSLNLSSAVAIAVFEALRQTGRIA